MEGRTKEHFIVLYQVLKVLKENVDKKDGKTSFHEVAPNI